MTHEIQTLPPDPFEQQPQTVFNLIEDAKSLEMDLEGFTLHDARRSHDENADSEVGKLIPADGGHVRTESDALHIESGVNLGTTALYAGHLAVRTGENVNVEFGSVIDHDDDDQPFERPGTVMPIAPYVRELRESPDQMYEPQHADFNFAVQDLYNGGRMTLSPEMQLSAEEQLTAGHAARRMVEDFHNDRFPYKPPRPTRKSVDASIQQFEADMSSSDVEAARKQTNEAFEDMVRGFDDEPRP